MNDEQIVPERPAAMNIATISAGFEKGDFLVREEQGNRVYFDFFEEAFNYISNKGYARMSREDEKHWVDLMNVIHDSVKGGMKYNTGTLLMVLSRPVSSDGSPSDKKDLKSKNTALKDLKSMNP
eukprot:CAMPEP_0172370910 /NCGR_PEP_ID=MMETSP1060-20121228/40356_1 /TAXON_ID=37318 /ORGANISM="Pseudo-nitzschia pungens, Strain cf. cingulata" /LENGTH=123 /DNA_ID=CAMNT_0013096371 /DNA_START=9 /DNA_END=380 /DNA_ORIENTATION=+